MIDTIIFDLDGVICSTDHFHYLAWKKLSDELHISFDETLNIQKWLIYAVFYSSRVFKSGQLVTD